MQTPDTPAGHATERFMALVREKRPELATYDYNGVYSVALEFLDAHTTHKQAACRREQHRAKQQNIADELNDSSPDCLAASAELAHMSLEDERNRLSAQIATLTNRPTWPKDMDEATLKISDLTEQLQTQAKEVAELQEKLSAFNQSEWEIADLDELYHEGSGAPLIDFIVNYMLTETSTQLGKHGWEPYESDGGLDDAIGYNICSLLRKAGVMDDLDYVPTHIKLKAKLDATDAAKDGAYLERNQVVAALASAFPAGIARTAIEGWSEDWHGCVYIDLPTGQASWHYHDNQAHLFAHLPPYTKPWDGHTTEEKYQRLAALANHRSQP